MTAVDKVFRAEAEPAAADRPLPKGGLDASGRSVFYRQLQQITELIREANDLEEVMREVSPAICKLFNADRLTLYGLDEDRKNIISKFKSGLASKREIKLPISAQSIAGYAALSHSLLNLADVYDTAALTQIHPDLKFLQEVDRRTGYHTREMLVAPIIENGELYGVLQIINNLGKQAFDDLVVEGVQHLCKALAVTFHYISLDSLSRRRIYTSKYSGLVIDGILTAEELQKCVQDAREAREPVERLLINRYQVSAAQIGSSLSKFFGVRYQPFNPGSIRSEMMHSVIKREFVNEQGWLPLEESPDGLVILCLDPEATRGARLVPQVFPRHGKFDYRVTTQLEFEQTLDLLFEIHTGSIDQLLADLGDTQEEEPANDSVLESAASDNELVKFVNKVIVDAYHQRASDIHVEPLPGKAKTGIRFRVDGTLLPYIEVPANFRQALVTRLKIMCDLDIAERRKPQDGKIKFKKFGPLDIELRVATIPSAGGVEDVVMRILAGGEPIPLENLGLSPNNRKRLDSVISKPYGLFYVCGPTGSGKTTTLHSILKILNTSESKIWTAEDPVEITQRGLRQVQINRKAGIDFAMLMRAFLRADPDIIMVGESRDHETVAMGIEASLTGHLVFSTLHTNSAPESIVRLLDMGMDPFNFSDALLGILAQRLAKKLCGECKEGYFPDDAETHAFVEEYVEELRNTQAWQLDKDGENKKLMASWLLESEDGGRLRFYRAVGCDKCNQSGYKGRLGLHELLVANDQIKKLVQERARVSEIFAAAVESGMRTLKMDGMEKVLLGLTDLRQVRAVCIK